MFAVFKILSLLERGWNFQQNTYTFSPRLQYVATLPYEVQAFKNDTSVPELLKLSVTHCLPEHNRKLIAV